MLSAPNLEKVRVERHNLRSSPRRFDDRAVEDRGAMVSVDYCGTGDLVLEILVF